MKGLSIKLLTAATVLSAVMLTTTVASAATTVPATDIPEDTNLTIIDTNSDGVAADTTTVTDDINSLVTEQGNETTQTDVTTNDGNSLPIDEGVTPPVQNEVDLSKPEEPNDPPAEEVKQETTVLTDKAPVVEPLPKTGLADTSIFIALGLLIIASVTLVLNRRSKEA